LFVNNDAIRTMACQLKKSDNEYRLVASMLEQYDQPEIQFLSVKYC